MSKPNGRRVKLAQFKQQLAEAVLPPDGKVVVEIDDAGSTIEFVVPLHMDPDDEYVKEIQATDDEDALAKVVLGDQLDRWLATGSTAKDFALLFAEEARAAAERMTDFRYRPSGK